MSPEIATAVISAVTTLLVSMGTWHVTMKQYRIKNEEMVGKAISDIKNTVTENHAQVQVHLAEIDLEIKTLSERVEKHNQVIDRTRELEKTVALNKNEIEHIREKVG